MAKHMLHYDVKGSISYDPSESDDDSLDSDSWVDIIQRNND